MKSKLSVDDSLTCQTRSRKLSALKISHMLWHTLAVMGAIANAFIQWLNTQYLLAAVWIVVAVLLLLSFTLYIMTTLKLSSETFPDR